MRSRRWQQRGVLLLLLGYSVDLVLKLSDWREAFGGSPLWGIALGLAVRFAIMGFILSVYLRLKKAPQEPPVVTIAVKNASVRSMRIFHIIMLAAVVGYLFVAERLPRPTSDAPASLVESFSVLAAAMVAIAYGFRRRYLSSAILQLQHNQGDATALGRWRMANVLTMTFTMSVALYGFALRAMGGNRRVVWPFFLVSVTLMLLWRPHLDGGSSTGASPPTPN
jgi:hypothetical protein